MEMMMKFFALIAMMLMMFALTSCPKGSSSNQTYWNGQPNQYCTLTGRWNKQPSIYVEPYVGLDGVDMKSIIEGEVNKVINHTDFNAKIVSSPDSADIIISSYYQVAWGPGKEVSSFPEMIVCEGEDKATSSTSDPLGLTRLTINYKTIEKAKISLNSFVWNTGGSEGYPEKYKAMVRHEFGHAIGLWHNTIDYTGIMGATISRVNDKQLYSKEELELINWIY